MTEINKRVRAADACGSAFIGRPLKWGVHDCIHLVKFNLHQLGVSVPLMKGVRYRTERGAMKALKDFGFADLVEAMDHAGFRRLPAPAFALPGDIVAIGTGHDGPWRAGLTIAQDNMKLLGFADIDGTQTCAVMRDPSFDFIAAWSAL